MAQMAQRWILDHEAVTVIIPGASRAAAGAGECRGIEPAPAGSAKRTRRCGISMQKEVASHIRGTVLISLLPMKNAPHPPRGALLAALAFNPLPAWADEEAELNDLPAAVQKTAHEEIGKSKVEEVEDTFEDGQHATEVEYTREREEDGGGHREGWDVDPEGVPDVPCGCARRDQEGGERAISRTGRFRTSRKWSGRNRRM